MTSKQGEGTSDGAANPSRLPGGKPTRRTLIISAAIAVSAAVFAAGAIVFAGDGSSDAAQGIVGAVTQTPMRSFRSTAAPSPTPAPVLTIGVTVSPTPEAPTDTAVPPTIDGAWSSTPEVPVVTPEPTVYVDRVAQLLASIQSQYGVRIVTAGQNWGDGEDAQLRYIGAVRDALGSVPSGVRGEISANPGGSLTFLSNDTGSTEGGWQPYGSRAANFYTNEDVVSGHETSANEIVLQPGSSAQTIAHEMMHAFQLRHQAPGDYIGGLLTAEMKSFMQATGWTQLVSDAEVLSDVGTSWEAVNADFRYDGRELAYPNEWGQIVTLYTPNPLEAYAEAGGLFYAHSDGVTLPDWPEYWDWFATNVATADGLTYRLPAAQ